MTRAADSRILIRTGRSIGPVEASARAGLQTGSQRTMGYQPSLDGLRAVSVIAVLFYHAGFSWMKGGFFGVEVFFVVSGFLITSLLIDELDRGGGIALRQFWLRRARRLFPALYAVLGAVAVWTALVGSASQQSQVRREIPWSILYINNWGQILGGMPYFAGDPSPLRHLWSLAVEEQWYVVWPLVFLALMRLKVARRVVGALVLGGAAATFIYMFWMQSRAPTPLGGPPAAFAGVDRTNYLYLSTITRAGGILLGAGSAFVWRPWQSANAGESRAGRMLDPLGATAVAALACAAVVAQLTAGYIYQWLLPLVSILSLGAVMVAVHPAAVGFRRIFAWSPLVEIGKRSYGLYLWSWPISVFVGATRGSVTSFVWAMVLTVIVADVSYRWIEMPVRRGGLGRWWKSRQSISLAPVVAGVFVVASLGLFYVNVNQFDRFVGGGEAVFELRDPAVTTTAAPPTTAQVSTDATDTMDASVSAVAPSTATPTASTMPVVAAESARLAIVGDSQANALAVNLPDGIGDVFPRVANGSIDGCSVYDSGRIRSSVSFENTFAICDRWQDNWAGAAAGSDVALVVLGAWDVFDIEADGFTYGFDTPEGDAFFTTNLESGIDAMLAEGAAVGLLEIACMRPQSVKAAGVRVLPERADDSRVAHLNELLREVSAEYGDDVSVVEGPEEWCNDEAIANDLGYRWDGVHVYKPGANLIYTTIAPDLLVLAAQA